MTINTADRPAARRVLECALGGQYFSARNAAWDIRDPNVRDVALRAIAAAKRGAVPRGLLR